MISKVLILVGPGFGHYFPISLFVNKFFDSLETKPEILFAGDFKEESSLGRRISEDGFQYISIKPPLMKRTLGRLLIKIGTIGLQKISELTGYISDRDGLPCLLSRYLFGVKSYCKEIVGVSKTRLNSLEEIILQQEVDLVLVDHACRMGVSYLAAKSGKPWVIYNICPAEVLGKDRPVYPSGFKPEMGQFEKILNNQLINLGTRRENKIQEELLKYYDTALEKSSNFSPRIKFCISSPEIDDYSTCKQNDYLYTGMIVPAPFPENTPNTDQEKHSRILVVLGSAPTQSDEKIYYKIIAATFNFGCIVYFQVQNDVLIQKLKRSTPLNSSTKYLYIKNSVLPPYDLYNSVNLVISHGGYGTAKESLYFGVPILLIPRLVADRLEVSRRVLTHKCGLCANYYHLETDDLRSKILRLLSDTEILASVKRVQADLRNQDRMENVICELTQLLANNQEN